MQEQRSEPEAPSQQENEPEVVRLDDFRHVPGDLKSQAWGYDALVRRTPKLSGALRSLLLYIYSDTGRRGRGYVYLSITELAEAVGTSRSRVRDQLSKLVEAGWIKIEDSKKKPYKNRIWFNHRMLFELMEGSSEPNMPLGGKHTRKKLEGGPERSTKPPEGGPERVAYKTGTLKEEENRDSHTVEPASPADSNPGESLVREQEQKRQVRIDKKLSGKPVATDHVAEWWKSAWNQSRFGKISAISGRMPPKDRGQLGRLLEQWRRPPEEIKQFIEWALFDFEEVLEALPWLKRRPDQPSPGWVLVMSPYLMEAWDERQRPHVAKEMAERGESVAEVLGWDRKPKKKTNWRWRGTQSLYERDDEYDF